MSVYVKGTYNVICDRCGYKYKAIECRLTWENLLVCDDCWEPRHPQLDVRAKRDVQTVPIPRPEAIDTFVREVAEDIDTPVDPSGTTWDDRDGIEFDDRDGIEFDDR